MQAILAARIDRLPADSKDLLQTLAVIGREFSLSLVREVTKKSDDETDPMLKDLQLGEFIYEQPAVGDIEYIFKHALTHDVAYKSVLVERRKLLHERIGSAMEASFAQSIDDHLSQLAYHYGRSANVRKALEYSVIGKEFSLSLALARYVGKFRRRISSEMLNELAARASSSTSSPRSATSSTPSSTRSPTMSRTTRC